jgi:parvulin-like peptidyl-prolyl isomerase
MRPILRLLIPILSVAMFAAFTGCAKKSDSIATIGSKEITMDDFRMEMVRQFKTEKDAARQPLDKREHVLNLLVERSLKVQGAKAKGYFELPEILDKKDKYEREALVQELYQREILEKVVTDELLLDSYNRQSKEVSASHLLLMWKEDSTSVTASATAILAEINAGLAFPDAAKKYTEEPGGGERLGALGWFSWGKMVPAFQETCWSMEKGQVSGLVETRFGIHIIHLDDVRQIENRPPFADMKEQIRSQAQQTNGTALAAEAESYITTMREEKGYKIGDNVTVELLSALQSRNKDDAQTKDVLQAILDEGWGERPLATWDGGQIGLARLVDDVTRNFRPMSSINTPDDLKMMIDTASLYPMLEVQSRALGYQKAQSVIDAVQGRVEASVLIRYEREAIKGELNITDEAIEAWYNNHLADYMHPKTVQVQEIYMKDKEKLTALAGKAKAGKDFTKLAIANTERPGNQNTDGILDPFGPGRYGKMGEAAHRMEIGEISDPLPIGRSWAVIKLLEQTPPKQKRLDECQTNIRMKLERKEREGREAAWRAEVEKLVPVTINSELLKQVYAD